MKTSRTHRPWVNFKELRARLRFEDVLRLHKVEVRKKGVQHQGPCPLPGHTGREAAPTFSANLERGIFQCFGCKAAGNVLEFAALMEKVDPQDGNALRKVAVDLQSKFFPEGASTKTRSRDTDRDSRQNVPVSVNAPLDFELKDLDQSHEYFTQIGISADTAREFGLGFCFRGYMKGRIAIPLHDSKGARIGYAGRATGAPAPDAGAAHDLFPERREREGKVLEFDKTALVYNEHSIEGLCDDLIVVEDFESVWWLHQNGFREAVALMSTECSERQLARIVARTSEYGRAWFLSNNARLASQLVIPLARERAVRWVAPANGRLPQELSLEELNACFGI